MWQFSLELLGNDDGGNNVAHIKTVDRDGTQANQNTIIYKWVTNNSIAPIQLQDILSDPYISSFESHTYLGKSCFHWNFNCISDNFHYFKRRPLLSFHAHGLLMSHTQKLLLSIISSTLKDYPVCWCPNFQSCSVIVSF